MVNGVVSFDRILPLDTLLHIAAWNRSGRKQYWREKKYEGAQYDLPLERFRFGNGLWCWACSFGIFKPVAMDAYYVTRKFPAERSEFLDESVKRVAISEGRFKGYRIPLPRLYTPTVEWIALGDGDKILDLLSNEIFFIGKKHNRGCGEVARWSVEESDLHPIVNNGRALRSVPLEWAQLNPCIGRIQESKLLPPYNPKSDTPALLCVVPN